VKKKKLPNVSIPVRGGIKVRIKGERHRNAPLKSQTANFDATRTL
jgi:hypothetical protein